ncbi:MAG: hypothetical protein ACXWOX_18135 [Ktedonobacteraceae bacterium]
MSGAEQRPEDNPPQRYKPVEFEPYQGTTQNYPTWSVFTTMTSYFETYDMLRRLAAHNPGGMGNVRRAVLGTVEHWKTGKPTAHAEATKVLVQGFMMNGVRKVEWTPVVNTLSREQKELGEVNELTGLAYELLSQTDWKTIVNDANDLTDADTNLRDWLEAQCHTWVDSPEARQYTGSVGRFANTVLTIYFHHVDWQRVTNGLRET